MRKKFSFACAGCLFFLCLIIVPQIVLAQESPPPATAAPRRAATGSAVRATLKPTPSPTPIPVDPSTPFTTSLETSYEVTSDGLTTVTNTFSVTNNSPTTFLKEYGLELHSTSIQNIAVTYNKEKIEPQISTDKNTTSIKISFPDEVVGQGKKRTFAISYQSNDIATVAGKVLEVHVPPFTSSESYTSRKVVLKTPTQFGRAIRITPEYSSVTFDGKAFITTFDQPGQGSISAFFGSEQYYKMTLRYNLENESSSPGIAQIALPPDTTFQKMHFISLDPMSNDLKIDEDGNWIATYTVPPQSALPVYLTANVKVVLEPNKNIPVIQPLPAHLKNLKYWETNNSVIKDTVQQYSTPETIYKHIVDTLSYSYTIAERPEAPTRLGAVASFAQPEQAVCQEFTDTFVTMSRAANIPARRLTGYAYTQNTQLRPLSLTGDVLHSWPEFYNAEAGYWQPVDPTWEDTTGGVDYFHQFDLSHIVFAINGVSSTMPAPAGAYNLAAGESKDVDVSFDSAFPIIKPDVIVGFGPSQLGGVEVPGSYTLTLTNKTGQAWYDIGIAIETSDDQVQIEYEPLPHNVVLPYQTVEIPIQLSTKSWSVVRKAPVSVKVTLPDIDPLYDRTEELTARNKILAPFKDPNVIAGVVTGVIIITFGAGSLLVFRRKR
jgi:transglutaminase-like putative cysteine protease